MTYNPHSFNVLFVKWFNEIDRFLRQQTTSEPNFKAFQQPQQPETTVLARIRQVSVFFSNFGITARAFPPL